MSQNSSRFTVDYTNMLKGVALLFLLCNHFCVVKDWITPPSELLDIMIKGKPLLGYVGAFGKICVAIWAFLSGVGTYHSYRKNIMIAYKNSVIRLVNLLIQYALILAVVFVPVIALCKPTFMGESYTLDLWHFVCNVFGCDAEYDKAAWYMRFYVMFVLSFPLIVLVRRRIENSFIFYGTVFMFFLFAPKLFSPIHDNVMLGTVSLRQALGEYCNYILIVIIGYMVAEYRMFERSQKMLSAKVNIALSVCFLIIAMALRSYSKTIHLGIIGIYTDILITPFVVYSFFVFFQCMGDNIRNLFMYIGKASMVVWLVHWIFNVGVPQIQAVAYFPRLSYLVILWVLIICIGFNYIFSYIMKKSNLLIKIKK